MDWFIGQAHILERDTKGIRGYVGRIHVDGSSYGN